MDTQRAPRAAIVAICLLIASRLTVPDTASAFTIRGSQKVSQTAGGFAGTIANGDEFGSSVAPTGDLDGDGIGDVIVGAKKNDDGGGDKGAAWVLFLNGDGTVDAEQKISSGNGNFAGAAGATQFGSGAASIGDLDGDGIGDVAVGAGEDNNGETDVGALWILRLNATGTVKSSTRISSGTGSFPDVLQDNDSFATSVAAIGDLDDDGVIDLAVGAPGTNSTDGAVWILFLNANGTVKGQRKLDGTNAVLTAAGGIAGRKSFFGWAVAGLGDVDGDGIPDLAVGAPEDDGINSRIGSVWIFLLRADGTLKAAQKITAATGGFTGALDGDDRFGFSLGALGEVEDDGTLTGTDLDGDGLIDLAVGAPEDDDGASRAGAVWVLHLASDGTVASHDKIASGVGGIVLANDDEFGRSVAAIGDLDGDGVSEIGIGASLADDGGGERGALWVLFPETCGNGIVGAGEQCDDGNRNDGDCCSASCQFEAPGSACDDGNVCTDDQCDATGTCIATANAGACDDGLFCNGTDTCSAGACSVHTGDPCLGPDGDGDCSESCDEILDNCNGPDPEASACDDGLFCNGADTCSGGLCGEHAGNPCPGVDGDGDCAETCDEAGDDCNDPDPDDSPCDDGLFCNGTDSCLAGACSVHTGDPCTGGSVCGNACDEGNQNCGVVNGSPCDDGIFCNGADSCLAGACTQHVGDPCIGPDGDADCSESCNEAGADCLGADPDGSACVDGLFCNGADSCSGGVCSVHAGDPCVGGPACADTCNETADDCLLPDGTACDDGLFCTTGESCASGACVGSGNPCGETPGCNDTCNESEGLCKTCGEPASGIYCLPNAVITLRAAIGLTTCDLCLCDVDGNGSVLVTDSLRILRVCVELDPPPAACPAAFELGGTTTTILATTTTLAAP